MNVSTAEIPDRDSDLRIQGSLCALIAGLPEILGSLSGRQTQRAEPRAHAVGEELSVVEADSAAEWL